MTRHGGTVSPRVVGLDLSITATGVAHEDGSPDFIGSDRDGDARLIDIRDAVRVVIGGCPPGTRGVNRWVDLAVLEEVPPVRAKAIAKLGMVHGVVRALLIEVGVPYALVPPASLKKYATGRGGAGKPDMRMELFKRTGEDVRDDNEVDAAWLRLMGLDAVGHPVVKLPQTHREALAKIPWPEVGTR
jgi:Holliday junction resolvasome RuvABC endonuclease subunit